MPIAHTGLLSQFMQAVNFGPYLQLMLGTAAGLTTIGCVVAGGCYVYDIVEGKERGSNWSEMFGEQYRANSARRELAAEYHARKAKWEELMDRKDERAQWMRERIAQHREAASLIDSANDAAELQDAKDLLKEFDDFHDQEAWMASWQEANQAIQAERLEARNERYESQKEELSDRVGVLHAEDREVDSEFSRDWADHGSSDRHCEGHRFPDQE